MSPEDLEKVLDELASVLSKRPGSRVAVLGRTAVGVRIITHLRGLGDLCRCIGMYALDGDPAADASSAYGAIERLANDRPDVVIVSEDTGKEVLLVAVADHVAPDTQIIIGGYGHLAFSDPVFERVRSEALVPSLANGYPNCLIHLYQCLRSAAQRGLQGVVAEFGIFRGGTTMMLSRFVEAVGADWKVIGFDTFNGFPPRRSALDLYDHPECVFMDQAAVRAYLAGRNVEIVVGDVVETASRLATEAVVLAFVDTDNHTSANAILDVVTDRVVVGGAIAFDHWAGGRRHLRTVGERLAASRLTKDARYFNLHDTGVFLRLA